MLDLNDSRLPSGLELECRLIDFASFGGIEYAPRLDQPLRYATNRVALTDMDIKARRGLGEIMVHLGAVIEEHPIGTFGVLEGSDPDLPPVLIMSHTDTVPDGDMYDGTYGVLSAIAVMEAIQRMGLGHKRSIVVGALTGEESSGFGTALFGSKFAFFGANENILGAHIDDGPTIAEVLVDQFGEAGLQSVKTPVFGEGCLLPLPDVVVELHVEQGALLYEQGIDFGVIEGIAAPVRLEMSFGEPLQVDTEQAPFTEYMEVTINGVSDHSGARPMGRDQRADGLVATAELMLDVLNIPSITIGDIAVYKHALNKVPGKTSIMLKIAGDTGQEISESIELLERCIGKHIRALNETYNRFSEDAISYGSVENPGSFFKREEIADRQRDAFEMIRAVQSFAETASSNDVVGTVGIFKTSDTGKITLGIDIRGVDDNRDTVVDMIEAAAGELRSYTSSHLLPGDSDPVTMDPALVQLAQNVIEEYRIGSHRVMPSGAGHDVQNAQRAGVKSLLFFVPSEKGVAHNPDAYTSPEHLHKGFLALLAIIMRLANVEIGEIS